VLEMLGHPTESPYGNPIPGLAELGDAAAPAFMDGVVNIVDLVADTTVSVRGVIRRLGEPVQFEPELLTHLQTAGVMPGATATISAAGSYVFVQVDGYEEGVELPNEVAVHIFVAA
jgi:DtxR family Mn-dependent transcriptional regulator